MTCTFEWLMLHHSLPGKENPAYQEVEEAFYEINNSEKGEREPTPVMVSLPERYKRETRLFERGSWMVPGEAVGLQVSPDKFGTHSMISTHPTD